MRNSKTLIKAFFLLFFCLSANCIQLYAQPLDKFKNKTTSKKNSHKKKQANYLLVDNQSKNLTLNFEQEGETKYIPISSSSAWTYTNGPWWLTLTKQSNGLYIQTAPNLDSSARNYTLTISNKTKSLNISISQSGDVSLYIYHGFMGNEEENGKVIDIPGSSLYYDDIRYLFPKIFYNKLSSSKNVKFYIKLISPDGKVSQSPNSPIGYSYISEVILPKDSESFQLGGFGNSSGHSYIPGNWRCEIYNSSFDKLCTINFTIKESSYSTSTSLNNHVNSNRNSPSSGRTSWTGHYSYEQSSNSNYPSNNFYLDLGASILSNPWGFGYNIGIGFNLSKFNCQILSVSLAPVLFESINEEEENESVAMELMIGYNFGGDDECRFKFTPQIGAALFTTKDKVPWGMTLGFRYDYLLCKHLSLYFAPKCYFIGGFKANFSLGLSAYI